MAAALPLPRITSPLCSALRCAPRRLMAAVEEYQRRTRQSVFVEYVMLGPGAHSAALLCLSCSECFQVLQLGRMLPAALIAPLRGQTTPAPG